MRRQSTFTILLCLLALLARAERIDPSVARQVALGAAGMIQSPSAPGLRSSAGPTLVYTARAPRTASPLRSSPSGEAPADYYVFNLPDSAGFVIVSGDDRALPVLGYSTQGAFPADGPADGLPGNLPDNLRSWLLGYQLQIAYADSADIPRTARVKASWDRYLSAAPPAAASPGQGVLLRTAKWNQYDPYDRMTPRIDGRRTLAGCTAVAQATIMRYHKYPARATGGVSSYQGIPITYDDYDWDNMPLAYPRNGYTDTEADAVAKLMWHCGANIEMTYGLDVSTAYSSLCVKSLTEVFGYSPSIRYLQKDDYRWDEWKAMIRSELDAGYPILYSGAKPSYAHAFVCDGYDTEGFFHMNWGWSGYYDGFFALSSLDMGYTGNGFSQGQTMLLHIRPTPDGERYTYKPTLDSLSYAGPLPLGNDSVRLRLYVSYAGLDDLDYYLGTGIMDSSGKITSMNKYRCSGHFEGTGEQAYSYKITVSFLPDAPLAQGERIAVLYSADGKAWEPMRTGPLSAIGLDNDGLVYPAADDPDDPGQPSPSIAVSQDGFYHSYLLASGGNEEYRDSYNTKFIEYLLTYVREPLTVRYTIHDYAARWKDNLHVYAGDFWNLGQQGEGTPLTLSADGSFELPIAPDTDAMAYIRMHLLKLLSDIHGTLTYDITAYPASDPSQVLLSETGHSVHFMKDGFLGAIAPKPIEGTAGSRLPFTLTFDTIDSLFLGTDLGLSIRLYAEIPEGKHFHLYQVTDTGEVEIPLAPNGYGYTRTTEPWMVGRPAPGQSLPFTLETDWVTVGTAYQDVMLDMCVVRADGKEISPLYAASPLLIHAAPTGTAPLPPDPATRVWAADGRLHIQTPRAGTAYVVSLDGRTSRTLSLSPGETATALPRGPYIIHLDGRSYKILLP